MTTARVRQIDQLPLAGTVDGSEVIPAMQGGKAVALPFSRVAAAASLLIPALNRVQLGVDQTNNTSDANKPLSIAALAALNDKAPAVATAQGLANAAAHAASVANPHNTTKAQVGLGSADNTSDAAKPVSTAQAAAIAVVAAYNGIPVSFARAAISAQAIPLPVAAISVAGFYSPGDAGQGAVYVRGTGLMQITDALGNSWKLAPGPTARFGHFGGRLDGNPSFATANDAAWDAAFAYMDSLPFGAELQFGVGIAVFASQRYAHISEGKQLVVRGSGKRTTVLQYLGSSPIVFLKVGSDTTYDSNLTRIEGFTITAPSNPAANAAGARAMDVLRRPGAILNDLLFENYKEGVRVLGGFATRFIGCDFVGIKGRAIYTPPDGTPNGCSFERNGVFGCGLADSVPAIELNGDGSGLGGGNGFSFVGNDIEGNYQGILCNGLSGGVIVGNYIERNAQGNLLFNSPCTAFEITGNWLGEQAAVATWARLSRSSICNNNIYDTTTTFDSTAVDLDFANVLSGTSTMTNGPPWNTATLQNGWAAVGGYAAPSYRRHSDGSIELKGTALNATTTASGAFTLPLGFRPYDLRGFVSGGLAGYAVVQIEINAAGNVVVYPFPKRTDGTTLNSGAYAAFDGIRFTV